MLSLHLREAERHKSELKHSLNAGARDVHSAAVNLSDAMLKTINEDVQEVYTAERRIEVDLRDIERLLSSNNTKVQQWTSLLERLTSELKELGDVHNWLEILEKSANEIMDLSKRL